MHIKTRFLATVLCFWGVFLTLFFVCCSACLGLGGCLQRLSAWAVVRLGFHSLRSYNKSTVAVLEMVRLTKKTIVIAR